MPNPENVIKHGIKKGEVRNRTGRPKKLHDLLKKEGLKPCQINDLILSILAMTKDELNNLCADPKTTSFELLVAAAIKKGVTKGDLSQIFGQALVRALGAPKQQISVNADPVLDLMKSIRGDKEKYASE